MVVRADWCRQPGKLCIQITHLVACFLCLCQSVNQISNFVLPEFGRSQYYFLMKLPQFRRKLVRWSTAVPSAGALLNEHPFASSLASGFSPFCNLHEQEMVVRFSNSYMYSKLQSEGFSSIRRYVCNRSRLYSIHA